MIVSVYMCHRPHEEEPMARKGKIIDLFYG